MNKKSVFTAKSCTILSFLILTWKVNPNRQHEGIGKLLRYKEE